MSKVDASSKTPSTTPDHPVDPLPIPPDLPRSKIRGIRTGITVFLLLFSAYLGSIFIQGPFLPLTVFAPKAYRRIMDLAIASWLMFTEFLIVRVMGCRVRHFGDPIMTDQSTEQRASLFLLNHRTQLDWFFWLGLGYPVQKMKIILKESLAKFPGAGWAMQCAAFIFLRRQIATDKGRIECLVDYLFNTVSKFGLLMFPEGTDLNRQSLARSQQFARTSNLPYTAYTMHPRSTGFVYLATLFGPERLGYVYDGTVAYPDQLPSPEVNIFRGQVPTEVHYHVSRFSPEDLPWCASSSQTQTDQLTGWLRARWSAKEELLSQYYATPIGKRCFENELPVQSKVFRFDTNSPKLTLFGLVNTLCWFLFLSLFVYFSYAFSAVRYFALIVQSCYIGLTWFAGGVSVWTARFAGRPGF